MEKLTIKGTAYCFAQRNVCRSLLLAACITARPLEAQRVQPTFINLATETVVASAVVTAAPYNADSNGLQDATAAIQAAANAVGALGGGVVYLPAGRYRLDGGLMLPYGVSLVGSSTANGSNETLLLAYGGRGQTDPALIQGGIETGVISLGIWYPEQEPENIVSYPPTITGGPQITIRNVTFYNSYTAIAPGLMNAAVIEYVQGTVLSMGIKADVSLEFSWIHDVDFNTDVWFAAAERLGGQSMTAAQKAALDQYVADNLIGIELERIDIMALSHFRAVGAATPVLIQKNPEFNDWAHGFGAVVSDFPGQRQEVGLGPWYYGMHYANLDNVPELAGRNTVFASTPKPARTDAASFIDVTSAPFNAVGDGVSDDTAAITQALAAAGQNQGGTVYLPQGRYKVTAPLSVPSGVELRGPMGTCKGREQQVTCSLESHAGKATTDPTHDTALITLSSNSGIRGFSILYPEQPIKTSQLVPYPFSVRGNGSNVWVVDMMLVNAFNGIDFASSRCDGHLVRGVWGTVFSQGIVVGGDSEGGRIERAAFSYGPWVESWLVSPTALQADIDAIAEYNHTNSVYYSFGDCASESSWGLAGFYPKTHVLFQKTTGTGCVDAELWLSLFDVGLNGSVAVQGGQHISLLGVFSTGGTDGMSNWLEVRQDFAGTVDVYAKTIYQSSFNHPYSFTAAQVKFHDEVSLTTGRTVVSEQSDQSNSPGSVVDGDPRTYWSAPAGSWVQVDLGTSQSINRFGIECAGLFTTTVGNPVEVELLVSDDGTSFRSAGKLNSGVFGISPAQPFAWGDMPVDPAVQGRYVRLQVDQTGSSGVVGISTFDVYSVPTVTRSSTSGRLINLSCRAQTGTGANTLIVGFVVGGAGTSGQEALLVRGSGPALIPFGVPGTLADPQLQLFSSNSDGTSTLLQTNNGWGGSSSIANTAAAVGAFAWTYPASHDSAIVGNLSTGPFTVQIAGQSGDTGVALAEIYDATPEGSYTLTTPRLINISARDYVGTGGNVLIAGFVIGGSTSETVLIRASGPALKAFGVSGVLADPQLKLYRSNSDGTSTLMQSNSGWGGDPTIAATAASVGAFSWGVSPTPDSAILATLPPGAYTAQVSGASGDTGVALVEVYEVQ